MITSIKISEDNTCVMYKTDDEVVHVENLTEENKDEWIKLACQLNNY